MTENKACPKCGAELPGNAPAGICPKCLMQAGLDSENESGKAYFASQGPFSEAPPLPSYQPPTPEELADYFEPFEIVELLGFGGMGAVYKARQKSLDRLVALKILRPAAGDPDFAERFGREAKALARLSHSSIVTVYDFGESDGLYYLVMEYVDGVNLRQAMQSAPLEPSEALQIVPQICDALQYAHGEGIVHRDIKPENILIDHRGRVKIADFGLAKLVGDEKSDPTLTGTRQVMGTLRYMAPEQMESSRNVDHRADIYSLGVVFYEMLTGETPIGHFEPPSKKAMVDARLDEVVLRALASEPERRFQQADDLKSKVEQITSYPQAQVPLPGEVANSQQGAGVSTIFEREAANLRNWFAPESAQTAEQHPRLPSALMILLSIAGCLMVLLPWMVLEIDQGAKVSGETIQLEKPIARTLVGSDRWPGIATAVAFGCIALLLLVTPSTKRLTLPVAVVLTLISACALLHTFLFRMDFESGRHPITVVDPFGTAAKLDRGIFSKSTDGPTESPSRGFATASADKTSASPAGKAPRTYIRHVFLDSTEHRIMYREGFYGSLGLSLVLLVLSATGVRHATVWRSQTKREQKPPVNLGKPRFSRKAIVGAVWAASALPLPVALFAVRFFVGVSAGLPGPEGMSDVQGTFILIPALFALLGLSALFGTTILGLVAIGEIRRSRGRLTGLGLAFFDAALFPTLLVNGAIFAVSLIVASVLTRGGPTSVVYSTGFIATVLFSLTIDVLVLRRWWRSVNEPIDGGGKVDDKPSDATSGLHKPADTAKPLASVRFSIPDEIEIGPQVVFHFTDFGYRLVEERPNEWIFQRGNKWTGLWLTEIRNCHTTLTVRSVTQPGGGLRVSCSWVVKIYGGFVSSGSIAELEAEGHELEALLRGEPVAPKPNPHTLQKAAPRVTNDSDVDGAVPASVSDGGADWVTLTRNQAESGRLPDVCMVCGKPTRDRVGKTFEYTPDWTALLLLVGIIPGLIAMMILSKKMRVACPVCADHRNHWTRLVWVASTGLLLPILCGLIGYLVALTLNINDEDSQWAGGVIGALVGFVVYLIPVIYMSCTRVKVELITDHEIRLRRVSSRFANAVAGRGNSAGALESDEKQDAERAEPPAFRVGTSSQPLLPSQTKAAFAPVHDATTELEFRRIEMRLKGPATGLIIAAILAFLFWSVFGSIMIYDDWGHRVDSAPPPIQVAAIFGAGVVLLLATATMIFGALKMRSLKSYEWCMVAAIVATVPWSGPAGIVVVPVGIWAFLTLRRPEVRDAFLRRAINLERAPRPQRTRNLLVPILIGLFVLFALFVCGAVIAYWSIGVAT